MIRERTSADGRPAVWKGVVAGMAGGLAASWTMNQFQAQLSKLSPQPAKSECGPASGDDATVRTASAISESIAGHKLTTHEKEVAGPVVHYVFGSTLGAMYGCMAEVLPVAAKGWGVPFGAAVWLAADEIAVPALGLGEKPTDTPASTHASALMAHLVYGLTADSVRRAVRAVL
jgi:putative membrane protein